MLIHRIRLSPALLTGVLTGILWCGQAVAACDAWPMWQAFKQHYVSEDGRVIDASTREHITTSEGQSYALLFALAANDRATFDALLTWTENNLAKGDLRSHLPAWQWGEDAHTHTWRVLDDNPASDADLWIAYALLEAARLWHEPRFRELGNAVASNVLRDEVLPAPGLGSALLPGPRGFVNANRWRFSASYLPLPVLRLLAKEHHPLWNDVLHSGIRIITASAPKGFAADWIAWQPNAGFITDADTHGIGSYNAIRVYLWTGMTHVRDADNNTLINTLAPAVQQVLRDDHPFESANTSVGTVSGIGSFGFAAAFVPLLQRRAQHQPYATRARSESLKDNQHYYGDVLTLFGLGWLDGWLRFDRDGRLLTTWSSSCVR